MSEDLAKLIAPLATLSVLAWCGIGGVVVGGSVLTFLLWPTHPAVGTIRMTSWSHTVVRQAWIDVVREDWCQWVSNRTEIPPRHGQGERSGVLVLHRESRYYGLESYACGVTVDANGHSRTKYCTRADYRDYCTYRTQEWVEVERRHLSGTGVETTWPSFENLPDRERSVRFGEWALSLQLPDRIAPYKYNASTESEYLELLRADPNRVIVNLRPFDLVKSVEPFQWESI